MPTIEEHVEGWNRYGKFMGRLNAMNAKPVTLKEAKERWKTWTRTVLTDAAKESFKEATWQITGNTPMIYSNDGRYAIAFRRNENGGVHGVDTAVPLRAKGN